MTRLANSSKRGFTLVELMAVVIITAVLATLAVYGVRKYVYSSKTTEAIHMIGSIKSAEESYRSETFRYLGLGCLTAAACAGDGDIDVAGNFYPHGDKPGTYKAAWINPTHGSYSTVWAPLGVLSDSPVIFEYVIVAGAAGGTLPKPSEFTDLSWGPQGSNAPGPWYVVAARADQNGDGKMSCFTSSNLTGEIFRVNEDE